MPRANHLHLLCLLSVALLLTVMPLDVSAQVNGSITQNINPSGGTEAAAMLETVGYRAQS
ncbi:MAG: hypothetical protein IT290_02620, partial [Deltaproteobacteria bacterium]|nr:hypothetical protein [Deltaproteobacteria bacterium]